LTAPEVLNDEESGFEVDWWSLGVVILELATGTVRIRLKAFFPRLLTDLDLF